MEIPSLTGSNPLMPSRRCRDELFAGMGLGKKGAAHGVGSPVWSRKDQRTRKRRSRRKTKSPLDCAVTACSRRQTLSRSPRRARLGEECGPGGRSEFSKPPRQRGPIGIACLPPVGPPPPFRRHRPAARPSGSFGRVRRVVLASRPFCGGPPPGCASAGGPFSKTFSKTLSIGDWGCIGGEGLMGREVY